jgi:hypothetical protein
MNSGRSIDMLVAFGNTVDSGQSNAIVAQKGFHQTSIQLSTGSDGGDGQLADVSIKSQQG